MGKKATGIIKTYPLTCLSCGRRFQDPKIWRSYCPDCKGAAKRSRRITIQHKRKEI